jgi:hypothetical protein
MARADEEDELELEALFVELVPVAALAERAEPRMAPPASPAVTRAADAQSLGLVRNLSFIVMSQSAFLPYMWRATAQKWRAPLRGASALPGNGLGVRGLDRSR